MILSKRERYLVIAAVLGALIFLLDRYVATPLLDWRAGLKAEEQGLVNELENVTRVFERRKLMEQRWKDMLASGLGKDVAKAESRVLHALQDWSQESGLALSALKPEGITQKDGIQEIAFQAVGTGPMTSVARFMWLVEETSLPLKIKQMQLGSRKEGVDDLSLQLQVSMLCLSAEAENDEQTTDEEAL